MEVATEEPITNAVPEGYKRTEVGVIPEDWEIVMLGDLLTVMHGKSQKSVESEIGEYPILGTSGQIGKATTYLYDKPSVLIGRKGTIDRPQYMEAPFWTIDTLFYTVVYDKTLAKYLYYRFLLVDWKSYNEASGVPSLNSSTIENIVIQFPPTLEEQQAIAESLSDVDALIAELDALIEKKQQIKKGAMQQLLTPPEPGQAGKKRLPGFDGEWEEKTFDECFHFLKTGTNSRSDLSDNGGVGYIHYGDIHAKWTDVLNCDEDSIPSIHKNKVTHLPRLEEGDLILADASEDYEGVGAGVEVKNLNGRQVVAGLHTILLRAKDGCIADGYKAYITSTKTVKKSLREIATGTTVYGISKSKLKQVKILLPPTIEEQKAIARILSDMDAEIQALQGKRRKYEKIKQGMMQELLTGKTRLV